MSNIAESQPTTFPIKILDKAKFYATHLGHFYELPKALSKSMVVHSNARNHEEDIDYTIQRANYQNEIYRYKEQEDMKIKQQFEKKLEESEVKIVKNNEEINKKRIKKAEDYDKHLKEIYKKFQEQEKRKRINEKEEAYKLRQQLKQFYEKQALRKKQAEAKQIAVGTCYQSAVDRINDIHKKNEEYSRKAQKQLNTNLIKNSNYDQIMRIKRRSQSVVNEQKHKVYQQSLDILNNRQHRFIQKYGNNEDGSIKAHQHIEGEMGKTTKRIGEFFKKRVEKWSQDKRRVDQQKAETPQRCLDVLDKTSKAAFRQTVSSFRSTAVEWNKTVSRNKSAIRDYDQMKKDEIMALHLDLRLKNNSNYKINEKMESMRQQARKMVADQA